MISPKIIVNFDYVTKALSVNFKPDFTLWRFPSNNQELFLEEINILNIRFQNQIFNEKLKEQIISEIDNVIKNWIFLGEILLPIETQFKLEQW